MSTAKFKVLCHTYLPFLHDLVGTRQLCMCTFLVLCMCTIHRHVSLWMFVRSKANLLSTHFTLWLPHRLHGINELLQLVRSRYRCIPLSQHPCSPTSLHQIATMSFQPTCLHSSSSPMFSLSELQEDVVTTFLAGKLHILDPSNLRTPFKFKISVPSKSLHPTE